MQLWDIEAHPELSLKGRFQRDENGDEVWVVVAKRTWQFDGVVWHELGESEIFDDPQYLGEEGFSAMKVDHEFAYTKENTDVLVYGKARSYAKKPVTYQECRVLIDGHIDKTLAIHGERVWVEHAGSITLSNPVPFIEKDIDYTCAVGGDLRNRIGGGVADSNKELLEQKVPSIFFIPERTGVPPRKNYALRGSGQCLRSLSRARSWPARSMTIGLRIASQCCHSILISGSSKAHLLINSAKASFVGRSV